MVFDKIFGKREEYNHKDDDSFLEIETEDKGEGKKMGKICIRVESLNDITDTDKIQKSLRRGEIVLVRIKGMKDKDIGDLKRSVEKLKKTCMAINGDIAGIEEEWIILTPHYAKVLR